MSIEAQFEAFVTAHHERAVRMAWRLTGADRATAEEIAQASFLAAHAKLGELREAGALQGWFYQILTRRSSNYRRWASVRRRFAQTFVPVMAATAHVPEPSLRKRIDTAIDGLSDGQRAVFVLVYLEGFTLDQSAQMLGKAPGTVRTHLHRALKILRRELGPVMAELNETAVPSDATGAPTRAPGDDK